MDDILGAGPPFEDDPLGSFYCPYTNTSECALITKGWQPQELCEALECEQMKYFQRRTRKRGRAA